MPDWLRQQRDPASDELAFFVIAGRNCPSEQHPHGNVLGKWCVRGDGAVDLGGEGCPHRCVTMFG